MGLKEIINNKEDIYIQAIERVKRVYKQDNIPWIIGYSGGKDSTATCTVILTALSELKKEEARKAIIITEKLLLYGKYRKSGKQKNIQMRVSKV